jgi:cytochrome b
MKTITNDDIYIWDPLVRLCHWGLVAAFIINYFIVEPGRLIHEIAGYCALTLIVVRIFWGFKASASSFASFKTVKLTRQSFKTHITQLNANQLPKAHGHNPFGWLMVFAVITLITGLGVTGFLMEEIDAFFGNSQLEWAHSLMADALYGCALVHIAAVFWTQHKGRIQLLRPMLTGKRKQ